MGFPVSYYICKDCNGTMDSTEALCFFPEIHAELDERPTEWIAECRCIYCGSDNLEEIGLCEECEGIFSESELQEGLCPECYARWEAEENYLKTALTEK